MNLPPEYERGDGFVREPFPIDDEDKLIAGVDFSDALEKLSELTVEPEAD